MKIIYIAGPFRGANAWEIESNIRRAETAGLEVAKLGAMPLIPHTNTRFFHGTLPDTFWLEGTLELLRRCDALYAIPGWERSSGTRGEITEANRLHIPVMYELDDVAAFVARLVPRVAPRRTTIVDKGAK